jgi:hypothetical protein
LRVPAWLLSSVINILVYELILAKKNWPARPPQMASAAR